MSVWPSTVADEDAVFSFSREQKDDDDDDVDQTKFKSHVPLPDRNAMEKIVLEKRKQVSLDRTGHGPATQPQSLCISYDNISVIIAYQLLAAHAHVSLD